VRKYLFILRLSQNFSFGKSSLLAAFSKAIPKTNRVLGMALLIFVLYAGAGIGAQTAAGQAWWYILEQGKLQYRNGAYGGALLSFEDARRTREAQYTRMRQDMITLLSSPEARRLGDDLGLVETYIADRGQSSAAAALAELYYRVPKQSLGNSAERALEELDRLKSYPEAEFWLGETYRAEGELGLALSQYRKAYDSRDLLETAGFADEILYKMSEVHRLRQEYQEMENTLLDILGGASGNGGDPMWAGGDRSFTRAAMSRTLENNGVDRFLTLYRHDNTAVEEAHRRLGLFYYASSRHTPAAEHLMFSFLIQNTLLIREVIRSQYDFTFTTLDALMEAIERRRDLAAYLDQVEYFRTVYFLSSSLYAAGKALPARQLWVFLAGRAEAGQWQVRAQGQLRSPYIDRAIEMP
jgi:hypothetical protein